MEKDLTLKLSIQLSYVTVQNTCFCVKVCKILIATLSNLSVVQEVLTTTTVLRYITLSRNAMFALELE